VVKALKKRLQQAQSGGELPKEIQAADFARYLSSVIAGLGVQAANGATRAELRRGKPRKNEENRLDDGMKRYVRIDSRVRVG